MTPAVMEFGRARVITPDGSHRVPDALWPDFAAAVLLEPEPEVLADWVRGLELRLGVQDAHRKALATPQPDAGRFVHGVSRDLLRAAFCEYFGLREEHADILVILYGRPGEPIPTRDLGRLLNSHRPPTRGAIHERIRFIREIIEPESLNSGGFLDDRGYFLTEVGMAECAEALRVMADVLLQCGPTVKPKKRRRWRLPDLSAQLKLALG